MFIRVYVILAILLIHNLTFAGNSIPQDLSFDESLRKLQFLINENMNRKHRGGMFENQLELREAATAKIEKALVVDTETHTRIIPEFNSDGLTIRLQYDETVEKRPELFFKDLLLFTRLTHFDLGTGMSVSDREFDKLIFDSPYTWAELEFNNQKGSLAARARLAHIHLELLKSTYAQSAAEFIEQITKSPGRVQNGLAASLQDSVVKVQELDKAALKDQRAQKKSVDAWRSQTRVLEKWESNSDKLNDLMLKNDRLGVAQMISDFLPWAAMEPSEANAWKVWLDAIRSPSPTHTTVAFRGIDYETDKIQRLQLPNGENRVAFMSTVLTKNQGNYTRRLRSLSVNRLQNGDISIENTTRFAGTAPIVGISDQMTIHAQEPRSSNFLSFTYDPWVAIKFIGRKKVVNEKGQMKHIPNGGFLAVKIDSRRLFPNIMSEYPGEIELLAPLVIFPDEVAGYKEGPFLGKTPEDTMDHFLKQVANLTDTNVTIWLDRNAKKSQFKYYFKRDGFAFMNQFLLNDPKHAPLCSGIFN
ncbi:hypothetical protein B9G69_014040 [Bdellovibrio sp. SKB1291214]|uniref:hypothetical protein n=1 Tax=Bdellovibrio sp. SKB1291214 TaxID=1732569 RepID=UPI000B51A9B4|nr:hypothetical protein [Bdellovibrio sp. SKB1291214]UYL08168.1 hypothetical protein B9G69_014040 [Bdellovibrio sp. SKB1291214]